MHMPLDKGIKLQPFGLTRMLKILSFMVCPPELVSAKSVSSNIICLFGFPRTTLDVNFCITHTSV